jgi:signal transduction histidine kinase/DNA-binding response OmpR family regulator
MAADEATKILVVDDLAEKLLVYRTILGDLGPEIVTARSGEDALKEVLRHDFAVILLDVYMPGGLNGLETAALIRKRKRSAHTPIIFLTAFGSDEVKAAEGYAQGAVDYITTPVVPEILRAKVRVFVDLYTMTQQVKRQAEERVALAEERTKRAAAEEATRRAAFLAEVSRALADSLDPDATARALARQAVPFLADLAGVTLPGEAAQGWRTELAWLPPGAAAPRAHSLSAADAPRDGLREAVDRVLSRGGAEVLDDLDTPYPEAAGVGPSDARVRSAVVVALRARGRTLGALTLAFGTSDRRHGPADVALAEDLASRAAIALDNARLYKELENADRQKNEFLSMLAHELRNPLAPIRNAAEVIRLSAPEHTRLQWAREVIDRQLAHLVRLVDDLLDVSRITRGKIRLQRGPVDVAEVARVAVEASRPLIEKHGHALDVSLPAHPVEVDGDPARLTQVLTNLLNNAAKYTEDGGRIGLAVGPAGDDVVVRVKDNGVGIPPEMLTAVFDLFTQADRSLDRSQGGLGVGLTLVKRLVELHAGTVAAHSDGAGKGSEFVVRLPRLGAPARPAAADRSFPVADPADRLTILLADDNVDGAESLATLLRLGGHDVRLAYDGRSALDLAASTRPDVVFLDIALPGVDGYEVARRLRAGDATRGIALIAVTGFGRDEDVQRARGAGFEHYLVKPVDPRLLMGLLGSLGRRVNAAR